MTETHPKRVALGFFAGVRAVFGGVGFVVGTPSIWGWAMIPVVIAALLFAAVFGLTVYGADPLAAHIGIDSVGMLGAIGNWLFKGVVWVIGAVVALVLSFSLAQPLSGFALEALARRQEQSLGGRTWPPQPFVPSALRSLKVSLTALLVGLPVLAALSLVSLLFPPAGIVTFPLKFLMTGLLAAYDFLDYPFGVRGQGVRARLAFMKSERWAVLGFGMAVAALLVIPGMGLFLLPFGVAGATRLVIERDRVLARKSG